MKKKILCFIFMVPLILIAIGWGINYMIEKNAEEQLYSDVNTISHNKVGMVLGTSKFQKSGGINLYFQYRVEAAVELFRQGKIDFILVSGDNSSPYYNEPKQIKEELVKKGIPEEKIFLDYAGFRTLDSVIRAKRVFGLTSLTIISQKFHNERAVFIANHNGINAIGYNAKDVPQNYSIKTVFREYFARIKAVLDQLLHTQPKFLGEKIEIK